VLPLNSYAVRRLPDHSLVPRTVERQNNEVSDGLAPDGGMNAPPRLLDSVGIGPDKLHLASIGLGKPTEIQNFRQAHRPSACISSARRASPLHRRTSVRLSVPLRSAQAGGEQAVPESEPGLSVLSGLPGEPVLPAHLRAPLCSTTLNTGRRSHSRLRVNSERFATRRLTPRCSGPHPGVRPGSAAELRHR
jgi:hypothetical protein